MVLLLSVATRGLLCLFLSLLLCLSSGLDSLNILSVLGVLGILACFPSGLHLTCRLSNRCLHLHLPKFFLHLCLDLSFDLGLHLLHGHHRSHLLLLLWHLHLLLLLRHELLILEHLILILEAHVVL